METKIKSLFDNPVVDFNNLYSVNEFVFVNHEEVLEYARLNKLTLGDIRIWRKESENEAITII